jgi:hypothetical protein
MRYICSKHCRRFRHPPLCKSWMEKQGAQGWKASTMERSRRANTSSGMSCRRLSDRYESDSMPSRTRRVTFKLTMLVTSQAQLLQSLDDTILTIDTATL